MKIHKLFSLFFLSIVLLNGCSFFSKKENFFRIFLLQKFEKKIVPSISWNLSIGKSTGCFHSNLHPAYIDDHKAIYAADRKGVVKAVNVDNGKEIWTIDLSKKGRWFSNASALLSGGIGVHNDKIYIGSEKEKVYAINNKNGFIVWEANVTGEVLSRPIVADGLVLIHTSNGQLQALDEHTGSVKWILELDIPLRSFSLRGESTPTVVCGMAVVGNKNGKISAVSIQEGQIIWQQRIARSAGRREIDRLSDIDTSPVVINNIVYAVAYNGNLAALDLYSGKIIWKCEVGSFNNFIVNGDRIYLSDQNGKVLAISAEKGIVLWTQDLLLHRFLTAPILYRNMLVVGDQEGYMYWIDPKNGHFITTSKVSIYGFMSDPIIASGKIVIQTKNGLLYAITC